VTSLSGGEDFSGTALFLQLLGNRPAARNHIFLGCGENVTVWVEKLHLVLNP
jgi:hypothetical protein